MITMALIEKVVKLSRTIPEKFKSQEWRGLYYLEKYGDEYANLLSPQNGLEYVFLKDKNLLVLFGIHSKGVKCELDCYFDVLPQIIDGILLGCLDIECKSDEFMRSQICALRDALNKDFEFFNVDNPNGYYNVISAILISDMLLEHISLNTSAEKLKKSLDNYTIKPSQSFLDGKFSEQAMNYIILRSIATEHETQHTNVRLGKISDKFRELENRLFKDVLQVSALIIAVFAVIGSNFFTNLPSEPNALILTNLSVVFAITVIFLFISWITDSQRKYKWGLGICAILIGILLTILTLVLNCLDNVHFFPPCIYSNSAIHS